MPYKGVPKPKPKDPLRVEADVEFEAEFVAAKKSYLMQLDWLPVVALMYFLAFKKHT